jgi:hypothetical protein
MPTSEFDSFLDSLYSSVDSVQEKINEKQLGKLRRLIEGNKDGEPKAITWMFCVPADKDKGKGEYKMELPLLSLRSNQTFRVSEVSIEFDSTISKPNKKERKLLQAMIDVPSGDRETPHAEPEHKTAALSRLVMTLKKWHEKLNPRAARVKISLTGTDTLEGEVRVNDQPLKKFGR